MKLDDLLKQAKKEGWTLKELFERIPKDGVRFPEELSPPDPRVVEAFQPFVGVGGIEDVIIDVGSAVGLILSDQANRDEYPERFGELAEKREKYTRLRSTLQSVPDDIAMRFFAGGVNGLALTVANLTEALDQLGYCSDYYVEHARWLVLSVHDAFKKWTSYELSYKADDIVLMESVFAIIGYGNVGKEVIIDRLKEVR